MVGPLVPAQAGTQWPQAQFWIPAFAGMSRRDTNYCAVMPAAFTSAALVLISLRM
jgi:hypothetical protein